MFAYLLEYNRYMNFIGIAVMVLLAYLFSNNRGRINYKLVCNGLLFQAALALFILKTDIGYWLFSSISAYEEFRHLKNFRPFSSKYCRK